MALRRELTNKLQYLNHIATLPKGYHYQIDSMGGYGGPRYYNLAVVRDDYTGGDFLDRPTSGGYTAGQFKVYLNGMLEGLRLQEDIRQACPVIE